MTDLAVKFTISPVVGQFQTAAPNAQLQFHHVNDGWLPALQPVGERYRRVGQAGSGAQTYGSQAQDVNVACSASFSSQALAIAFLATLEALPWQLVTVLDAWGRTIPRARVTAASGLPKKTKGPTVAGVPAILRVDCQITLERLPDT